MLDMPERFNKIRIRCYILCFDFTFVLADVFCFQKDLVSFYALNTWLLKAPVSFSTARSSQLRMQHQPIHVNGLHFEHLKVHFLVNWKWAQLIDIDSVL